MNDTKDLAVKICMDGLKEIILEALVEPKRDGNWLGPSDVRDASGILKQFENREARKWATPFTRAILCELRGERRVLGEKRGPLKGGEPTIVWQLTDAEYQKRRNSREK